MTDGDRWAWVEVDLDAIAHNVEVLAETVAPAEVWAVVKADGYGHGAVEVARTAIEAGASGLCVALVQEGVQLRRAGLTAPVLVLSEQPPETAPLIVEHDLTPTVYRRDFLQALVSAGPTDLGVHLKIDTGMQRVGVHPHAAAAVAESIVGRSPELRLAGVYTHLATADGVDDDSKGATADQLERFDDALARIPALDVAPRVHAANSAAAIAHADARRDLARVGIAAYGISPSDDLADHPTMRRLRPAIAVRARVSLVKQVRSASRISYGLRHRFDHDTTVATVPIGYADGVPRRLWATGGQVLIGGRRHPIVGVVTMDQLMIDCGDSDVRVGDEVTLLGAQGDDRIRPEEWAHRLDTIGYEIVCGFSERLPRLHRRSIES
ncbi:MAG: alanine racemase [Actinomycetota bacterium]